MTEYAVFVESGPKRRKTMVHVMDLLGCVANGPTTAEALEATPAAIRKFLDMLMRHGDDVDPGVEITIAIAAHMMEGSWIGQGDPIAGFATDFVPLTRAELEPFRTRLGWLHEEFLALIDRVPAELMPVKPEVGRDIYDIIRHTAASHGVYLRQIVGKVEGLNAAYKPIEQGTDDLPAALTRYWAVMDARLAALTDDELTGQFRHGQLIWTARRGIRRMLEHEWEHMMEIEARLGASGQ